MARKKARGLDLKQLQSRAQTLRAQGKTAAQIANAVGRSESWVYANTTRLSQSDKVPAPTVSLNDLNSDSLSWAGESLLRYDILPEDVLDQETLDEIDRKFAASEVNFQRCLDDGTIEERLLTVDVLRELAERVRRGERVSLKKT